MATDLFERTPSDDPTPEPGPVRAPAAGPQTAPVSGPAPGAGPLMRDLLISDTPAATLWRHWAAHSDAHIDHHSLTVVDPVGIWAPSLLKAVADACGQPLERMSLRDSHSLRAMATVLRTSVPQRDGSSLHLQHSEDSRGHERGVPVALALMPRSQMSSIVIGPMAPPDIDTLLADLHRATWAPDWHCPALQFLLPHNAAWIANKVSSTDWPRHVQVLTCQQALVSSADVWNALQAGWAVARTLPRHAPGMAPAPRSDREPATGAAAALPQPARTPQPPAELSWAQRLDTLMPLPGVLACAAIDAADGGLLARRHRASAATQMARTALRLATWLRAENAGLASAGRSGADEPLEELLASTPHQVQLLRRAQGPRPIYWLLLLDRQAADLPSLRQALTTL